MATAAQRFATFTTTLAYADLPGDVVEAAKLHLLDTVGCGLAAHALHRATEGRAVMAERRGSAEATAIGLDHRLPAASAAFANAMLCHALDFDDTHSDAVCHVTVVIGPTALAVGERRKASGRALLEAIVGGNEVVTRLGTAVSGAFHSRGFHPTAICGIFGATATATRLEGLDIATSVQALGIAGSLAGGLLAYLEEGTPTKPIHPASAAHGAITATQLAAHGAGGPASVLEGRFGLFHAFVGREGLDLEPQLADLGSRWETLRIAYKPYPACHFMHGVLAAVDAALNGRVLANAEIEDVVVTVPEAVVPIVLEPLHAKVPPRTEYDAKFSLQYSTAAMLLHGRVDVSTYSDAATRDPEVLAVARRVRYEPRDYPSYPRAFPGGVRIKLRNGAVLQKDCLHQKGSPENALSREEVCEKFRSNAALALSDHAVKDLETALLNLEDVADLSAALAPLREAPASPAPHGRQS